MRLQAVARTLGVALLGTMLSISAFAEKTETFKVTMTADNGCKVTVTTTIFYEADGKTTGQVQTEREYHGGTDNSGGKCPSGKMKKVREFATKAKNPVEKIEVRKQP